MYQSVHDVFVRLETNIGHVYNRREKNIEHVGREYAPLAKALFHSEPPRTHPVAEPHACSHAIMELTNDRDRILRHAKTGERSPEKGSVNGVKRFGEVDKAYKPRAGLRHAVVCPNVTGRTKERIAQSKRARAGSLALVD